MKTKIICILILTLLIATVIPAIGMSQQKKVNEEFYYHQISYNRAPYIPDIIEETKKPSIIGGTPFYADIIYDPNGTLTIGPCEFLPSSPGTLNSLGPTSCAGFLSGGTWMKGEWWACEAFGNKDMWKIDVNTGAMTLMYDYDPYGELDADYSGLAYDPITDLLFGCTPYSLYIVTSTGQPELQGYFPPDIMMIGIAFDELGILYGVDIVTDMLYEIDSYTATLTAVGSLNIDLNYAQDMSFDMDTGLLYLSALTVAPVGEGALYLCDKLTGATTKLGTFENSAELDAFAIPYNLPPTPPVISGPVRGVVGNPLTFSFTSTDPEGDQVSFYIDWDNGVTPWTTYIPSGTSHSESHVWNAQGMYTIKAKAKDTNNAESGWGYFQVKIPRDKAIQTSLLHQFLHSHPNLFPLLRQLFGL
jgi:hypothetical protein